METPIEWIEYRSSTTVPSVVRPVKSWYFTSVWPGPVPPAPPGPPEGMPPFGAPEGELDVSEALLEQPVMVAGAAAPPASSTLFMNQRRLRPASGVRRWCPCVRPRSRGNLKRS
ncbi:hypothetical protein [Streptomyces sp. NPDC086777]|uniref:hypothetical protein n=1 Tax=Streptomyces sp. NPDC086777 TaxID=3154866 RepID=UPI003450CF3B